MTSWDFVKSRDAAEALCREGRLMKTRLVPGELGGDESPENVVYIPPAARIAKDRTTAELIELFRNGLADQMSVIPEYRGDSFVPSHLLVSAWRSERAPAYEKPIAIW